jgi:peroxiredoxin Q/BCP
LRDSWASVQGKAQIFGVSVDSPKSHRKFIDKYELPFPLLSDPEKEIVNAYGVWVEKSMYGRKYMGAERSTFIVDANGRIAAIFRKVKPEDHVGLVRGALKNLADK